MLSPTLCLIIISTQSTTHNNNILGPYAWANDDNQTDFKDIFKHSFYRPHSGAWNDCLSPELHGPSLSKQMK